MNIKSSIVISGLIALSLVIGIWNSFHKTVVVQTPAGPVTVGAGTGPENPYNYACDGGACVYKAGMPFNTASSTLCAFKSPAATSTLTTFSWVVTTASSTATTLQLATSTTPFATTTNITSWNLASGAQGGGMLIASTTDGNRPMNSHYAPNTYVVLGETGFNAPSTASGKYLGSCMAEFTPVGSR